MGVLSSKDSNKEIPLSLNKNNSLLTVSSQEGNRESLLSPDNKLVLSSLDNNKETQLSQDNNKETQLSLDNNKETQLSPDNKINSKDKITSKGHLSPWKDKTSLLSLNKETEMSLKALLMFK